MARPYNNINYDTVSLIPPNVIVRRAYNASNQLEYEGHAIKGTANSSPDWTVKKITYTSNQNTAENIAYNIAWDDRTTATYS